MTDQQREMVEQILRDSPVELGGDAVVQRPLFEQMLTAHPAPDDVLTTAADLGGVPAIFIDIAGLVTRGVILFLHGGGYALGSAASSVGLASALARKAAMRVVTIDYRLAPEHPHPAALHDAVAAYRALLEREPGATGIAIAGESAGAGLAAATLVAIARAGLPQPSSAVLMSPWADLSVPETTLAAKAGVDPVVTPGALRVRAGEYAGGTDLADPLLSPVHADLHGLPPLLIQAGSSEHLLDDAIRLAIRAAADDVAVTLDVTPGVLHVFQAFAALLDEGEAALARAGAFLRTHTRP